MKTAPIPRKGAVAAPAVARRPTLPERLSRRGDVLRLIGVHDVMGAWAAERAGFDGLWASSLEITTSAGRLDDGWEAAEMVQERAAELARATRLPLVADCQVCHADAEAVVDRLGVLGDAGVAGVCLQDSLFPCPNSLLSGQHPLAPAAAFARAVGIARDAAPASMAVIARVQALVAGAGQAEARRRAQAYADTGADAIVIHSRQADPGEVLRFLDSWPGSVPVVLIPSSYPRLTLDDAKRTGKVGMMIYANHGLRASLAAMERVFREIIESGGSLGSEDWIAPLGTVFHQQQDPRTARP